ERLMATVRVVNLRVSYQAEVHRKESEEFYTRHRDAQDDRAVRAEIETQLYCLEWQGQDVDNHTTRAMMRIHALEDRARINTLEDNGSSA
nr:hypothetical protein [Tanacetum cinerariifolium]